MLKSENVENGNLYIYIIDKFGRMVLYDDVKLMVGSVLVLLMIWMSELQVIGKSLLDLMGFGWPLLEKVRVIYMKYHQ